MSIGHDIADKNVELTAIVYLSKASRQDASQFFKRTTYGQLRISIRWAAAISLRTLKRDGSNSGF